MFMVDMVDTVDMVDMVHSICSSASSATRYTIALVIVTNVPMVFTFTYNHLVAYETI